MSDKRRINIMLTLDAERALRALFDALGIQGQRADANLQPGIQRLGDWCQEVGPETAAVALAAVMSVSAADTGNGGTMVANDHTCHTCPMPTDGRRMYYKCRCGRSWSRTRIGEWHE